MEDRLGDLQMQNREECTRQEEEEEEDGLIYPHIDLDFIASELN